MSTFAGYEIVRELWRGPLGFQAVARRDGGPEVLLDVRHADPIAAAGEEMVAVEQFLAQAEVQRAIDSAFWVKVFDVGREGDSGFAAKKYYPQRVLDVIESLVDVDAGQLRQLALNVVDGLIVLRDQCGGRGHGGLTAARVSVADVRSMRVLLDAPGELVAAGGRGGSREDLRALAKLLIDVVEKRVAPRTPPAIGVSERWKVVAGAHAEAWVTAMNRLLDPHAEPGALALEAVRDLFAGLQVPRKKKSKAPMVIAAGVLLLAVAGGVFFATRGGGGGEVIGQDGELETPGLDVDLVRDWLAADWFIEQIEPKTSSNRIKTYVVDAAAEPEQLLAELTASGGDTEAKAAGQLIRTGLTRVDASRERLQKLIDAMKLFGEEAAAPALVEARDALARVSDRWKSGLTSAAEDRGQALTEEELAAAVNAVQATGEFNGLEQVVSGVTDLHRSAVQLAGRAGDDAFLKKAVELAGAELAVDGSMELRDAFAAIERQSVAAQRTINRISQSMDAYVAGADRVEFARAVDEAMAAAGDRSPLDVWLEVFGRGDQMKIDDPLVALDQRGAELKALAARLEGLSVPADQAEAVRESQAALQRVMQAMAAAREESKGIARIRLHQAELQRIASESVASAGDASREAERLIGLLAKTRAEVIANLDARPPELSDEAWAVLRGLRQPMRAQVEQSQESDAELRSQVTQRDTRNGELVRLVDARFGQQLNDEVQSRARALSQAFDAVRTRQLQASLSALGTELASRRVGSDEASETLVAKWVDGRDASVQAVGKSIEAAFGRIGAAVSDLDAWRPLEQVKAEYGDVLAFAPAADWLTPEERTALDAGFAAAAQGLVNRIAAADAVGQGATADGLLRTVRTGLEPELRWAAYAALGGLNGWPGSVEDVRRDLEARTDLRQALGAAAGDFARERLAALDAAAGERWHRALSGAGTIEAFDAVYALGEQAGVTSGQELTASEQRGVRLVALWKRIGEAASGDEETADQRAVAALDAWLGENAGAFGGAAAPWLESLRQARTIEGGSGGGKFDPASVGPASTPAGTAAGWNVAASDAEDWAFIEYGLGAERLRLNRVPGEFARGSDEVVWFLQSTEVTIGQVAEVCERVQGDSAWLEPPTDGKPLGWSRQGESIQVRSEWVADGFWQQAPPPPSAKMPMQQISAEGMKQVAQALGLELPPVEVWEAASQVVGAPGTGGMTAAMASSQSANVQDQTWRNQYAFYQENFASKPGANNAGLWMRGYLDKNGLEVLGNVGDSALGGYDDGHVLFAEVDRAGVQSQTWHDMFGNVAEAVAVSGQDRLGVVGGSAMCPPANVSTEVRSWRQLRLADVGFRLALAVPKKSLQASVAERVVDLLQEAPAPWGRAGP